MPVNMADIPPAPQDLDAKAEPSDDGKPGMLEMSQDEVDAIIRNKRKVRDPKACYACHRRKVKCDRNLPCDSCVKRDHPELCSYERPTKKRRIALTAALAQTDDKSPGAVDRSLDSGSNITVPREQWENLNRELAQLRVQAKEEKDDDTSAASEEHAVPELTGHSDDGDREGVHAPSNQMGTMHLGSRSVLAYMVGNRTKSTQDAARLLLEKDILPNLGLDNENTTYPFVDLWSTDSNGQDVNGLVQALPDDSLCREFWLTYRDIPCVIYPVVPDAQAFQNNLEILLQNRADMAGTGVPLDPDRPYGVSMPWLALLFAVLASGSQSTGRPAKERELTSQVYICCSYQALRNALSYNMNPGVSYIILGMTLRSAFSMGLHVNSPNFTEAENYLRSRIWWALAWQDSHFSISYDRPSSSIMCFPNLPYTRNSTPGDRTYVESMTGIIKLTQKILRERACNPKHAMSWSMIMEFKDEVHRIWNEAQPQLRDSALCISLKDHLERLALQIHCSYLISEICRPALKEEHLPGPTSNPSCYGKQSPVISPPVTSRRKPSTQGDSPATTPADPQVTANLRSECIEYLQRTVETYIELRSINKFAARSWIGIQRSVSAAFMLAVMPETQREPRIIALLTRLESAIAQSAIEDIGFRTVDNTRSPTGTDLEGLSMSNEQARPPLWVRSMTKSLNALSKLNAALARGRPGSVSQPFMSYSTPFQSIAPDMSGTVYNYNVPPINTDVQTDSQHFPSFYNHTPRASERGSITSIAPYTPESLGSDWNSSNIPQRAFEHIPPGIWGR
ncbi:hypothetical protein LTR05_002420 [Lithohypha guttulata]|uniref:Zn(2)-C6 fungal-type domain-containing protein n=1 Tax=Lithohypha guttulata TaxID=1690604 RepID=A0AAN7T4A2_9EURO|nr:hypothetical protein LTR05_002420 [Lithohypha guttulata]